MEAEIHEISTQELGFHKLCDLIDMGLKIRLSNEAKERIVNCHDYLQNKMKRSDGPIYGINTGFGSLYKKNISTADLGQLQLNLVMSHACGTGPEVPQNIVKLMLLLKVKSLAFGNSGVQLETVERLIYFYNEDILPVIYEQGSLGASGDLAPLAHLSLPLAGLGEVNYKGKRYSGEEINSEHGLKPINFKAKEGLALLNGTQFMSAYGLHILHRAHRLIKSANLLAALSIDAFDARIEPFDELIHDIRPHEGQLYVAESVRKLLKGSELISRKKQHVQDPYAFRCVPQVHGASKDTFDFVTRTFLIEMNAVTDNPNIFPAEDRIISGGNFHGQPLALGLDFLAIALAELGNISERRIYQLVSGLRDLPEFLVANPGLNSGMMIVQYTAASIVSQNKQYCTPASVDSIVSSNGQEDHVSMGANAAVKCLKVLDNLETVLGIELLVAAQALDFRRPAKSSELIEMVIEKFRSSVPFITQDRVMHTEMKLAKKFINELIIDEQ